MTRTQPVKRDQTASKDRLRLWLRLLRSTRYIESVLRARLRKNYALTLSQFDVLAALSRSRGGMIMSEVSHLLMVSNGNITGIVDRLVDAGLVVRSLRGGDRRTSFVRLTKPGQKTFDTVSRAHEKWVDELLQDFSTDDTTSISTMLSRLKRTHPGNQK